MTRAQWDRIRILFEGKCAYCGVNENSVGAALTIDHFRPRARGGTDEEENLVLSCHACNEFKGDFWPDETSQFALIHPNEAASIHIAQGENGLLTGLSPRGEAHISQLRLNRPQAVNRRLEEHNQLLLQARLEAALERIQIAEEKALNAAFQLEEQKSSN